MRIVRGPFLTQIEEGYECDIFFSAAQKQMDQLEADGLIVYGTRKNVVNNQVVLLTRKDSGTEVPDWKIWTRQRALPLPGEVYRLESIQEKRLSALRSFRRQRMYQRFGQRKCQKHSEAWKSASRIMSAKF